MDVTGRHNLFSSNLSLAELTMSHWNGKKDSQIISREPGSDGMTAHPVPHCKGLTADFHKFKQTILSNPNFGKLKIVYRLNNKKRKSHKKRSRTRCLCTDSNRGVISLLEQDTSSASQVPFKYEGTDQWPDFIWIAHHSLVCVLKSIKPGEINLWMS